ncbi:MAG TPA: hypothetical protein VF277_07955, partial [Steroidobacteraceae bacterium]
MTKRRWFATLAIGCLLVGIGGGALFVHRLLYTPEGLDLLLRQLGRLDAVKIEVSGAHGVLAGALSAERVVVDHEAVHIEVRNLGVHPQWSGALAGIVTLDELTIGSIAIRLKEREDQPPSETHFLPAWLQLAIPQFVARNVSLTLAGGERYPVRQITGTARITRWRIALAPVAIDDPLGHIAGDAALRAGNPLGLRGEVRGAWKLPDERTYQFTTEVRGDLDQLGTDIVLQQPAPITFRGNLLKLTEAASVAGVLRVSDFDGSPWLAADVLPKLTGSVALIASAASIGLGGTLASPSIEGGQLRVRGGGTYRDGKLQVRALRAWFPRSGLAVTTRGAVDFTGESPRLALEGDWTALRWPLGGDPIVESRHGLYTLSGALPFGFTAQADVRGPSIPAAAFDATGTFDNERVVLERLTGTVMKGRLQGSGQLAWVGDRPWRFSIAAQGLDVTQIRPEVQGRVNFAGTIDGQGFESASPWTARITSMSGTLFNRALTGRGEISHHDDVFDLKQVRISNGASNVDINGRYGAMLDLRWDANLQSLAIVAPGLSGQLLSSGTATGTAEKPQVVGEAHIRKLRYGDVTLEQADATIDLDVSDRRSSRVELHARNALAGG